MNLAEALRVATLLLGLAINSCRGSEFCDSKFQSADQDQARILRGLANVRFSSESQNDSFRTQYSVSLCGNASKNEPLAGVLQNGTTVLGRVNDTHVLKGDGDWMMMIFGSGDRYPENSNCSGPRYTLIMIHCNHNISSENTMRFIKEAKGEKSACFFMFEIQTNLVCIQPEKIGAGTVFTVLLFFVILIYIIGGILYKRLVLGAKGLEQIPNITFWNSLGTRLVDTCNRTCCKKSSVNPNSWDNLGPRIERDDDSLLPP